MLNKLLEKKKIITETGCWICPNYNSRPIITIDGEHYILARLIFALSNNLNYYDYQWLACHKNECNNKLCWNPTHIYKGNESTNTFDAIELDKSAAYHRRSQTHCKHGHEFTPWNTRIKKNGTRNCKACHVIYERMRKQKIKGVIS